MAAVEDGNIEVLRALLAVLFELSPSQQAKRLKVRDNHGWTALHDAAFHGFEEAVDSC